MSARALAATLAALALIGLLGFGLISKGSADVVVGDAAPDAELPLLDGDGTGSVGEHRGDWVLVNFWASWCAPCRDESPALQRLHERHGEELVVLGIDTQDLTDDATDFVDEFDLTYPILRDPDTESPLSDEYGATGLPESFLVDPDGDLAAICRGPLGEDDLEGVIVPLVEGNEPTAAGAGSSCRTEGA
jgi:cytochrome c biogenesis protein CcmG, thiol:disulfide interchange protein DsbE